MLRRTRRGLIALTLAGTLALAGCAAGTGTAPTASAQDVGAACAAVRENVADAAERLTQLDVTDPQASARVMGDVAASRSSRRCSPRPPASRNRSPPSRSCARPRDASVTSAHPFSPGQRLLFAYH